MNVTLLSMALLAVSTPAPAAATARLAYEAPRALTAATKSARLGQAPGAS